jgi:hypothetical protein
MKMVSLRLAEYLITNYGMFMNDLEKEAIDHMRTTRLMDIAGKHFSHQDRNLLRQKGLLSSNPKVLELANLGQDSLMRRIGARIISEHGEEVRFDFCPDCGKLLSSPGAQCDLCIPQEGFIEDLLFSN